MHAFCVRRVAEDLSYLITSEHHVSMIALQITILFNLDIIE